MAAKKLPRGIDQPHTGGLYRARIFVDGKQHALGMFHTIGDARAALDIARGQKARGSFVPPSEQRAERKREAADAERRATADSRPVRELAEAWLSWLEDRGRKVGTVYTYRRRLEAHFLPEYGSRPVSAVTADDLHDWAEELKSTAGTGAARPVVANVVSMFTYAAGRSRGLPRAFQAWITLNPADALDATGPRRRTERTQHVATPDDIAALANGMPAPERLAVLLAGWCGLRLGEVLGLRRRHLSTTGTGDREVWWITVERQVQARGSGVREETPKSAAGLRTIPVPGAMVHDLRQHLDQHAAPGHDGLLFPRHAGGNDLHHPNTVRAHFNASLSALNTARERENAEQAANDRVPLLDPFTFHGLRHTALTRLGQAGATLAELQAYAGHSDVASVQQYQHAEQRRLAALASVVSTHYTTTEDL